MSITRPEVKTTVYIGGLDMSVNEEVLYSLFIPFGEIKDIVMPKDYNSYDPHRGFAFIEYELAEDARSAIENMHLSELCGKYIKCSLAKNKLSENEKYGMAANKVTSETPIWESDEWLQKYGKGGAGATTESQKEKAKVASSEQNDTAVE